MTNEEIISLINQGIDIKANMGLLYAQNRGFIYAIAKRYTDVMEIDDLMQEGYFGLHKAVERYSLDHDSKFLTYAECWIKQTIHRYVENNSQTVRLPSHAQALIGKYKRYKDYVMRVEGREPTMDQYMRHMGIDNKKLKAIETAMYRSTIKSLDAPVPGDDDTMTLANVIPDTKTLEDSIDTVCDCGLEADLWGEVRRVIKDDCTYEIIEYRYKTNMSLQDIGDKLGITGERVRQKQVQGLRALRHSALIRGLATGYEIVNFDSLGRKSTYDWGNDWLNEYKADNAEMDDIADKQCDDLLQELLLFG